MLYGFHIEIWRDNDSSQVVFRRSATTESFFDVTFDDGPSAGTHSYNVYVRAIGNSADSPIGNVGTVGFRQIAALVVKR
jgi:hypothetical protein